jgi:hypothetical protein
MKKETLLAETGHDISGAVSILRAGQISGVGRTLIFAEIKAGRLKAKKCGRRTLILLCDLQEWLQALPSTLPLLDQEIEA